MKDFFEGIQYFCEEYAFAPLDALRALQLENWTAANVINLIFMLIGSVAFIYWMLELKKFNATNEEDRDPKAHSFLG